jgi:hypothetical protein
MSITEALWTYGFLGLLLLASLLFMRLRRRTEDFTQMRGVKRRLSSWAGAFEKLSLYAVVLATGGAVFRVFAQFHKGQVTGATAVYAVIGAFLIAIPVGALGANGISWIVPPLRRANQAAMAGAEVSFSTANRGLFLFAAVSIPVGLIALAAAALEPWAR